MRNCDVQPLKGRSDQLSAGGERQTRASGGEGHEVEEAESPRELGLGGEADGKAATSFGVSVLPKYV